MTPDEHKQRHLELHKMLDELIADFLRHNPDKHLSSTVMDLLKWSHSQTQNPTES